MRCNVINFLTDSIVVESERLNGDFLVSKDTGQVGADVGHKHYSEWPAGTFPDNVHFINMTRSWTGCSEGGRSGKKSKVCRHIWEKM